MEEEIRSIYREKVLRKRDFRWIFRSRKEGIFPHLLCLEVGIHETHQQINLKKAGGYSQYYSQITVLMGSSYIFMRRATLNEFVIELLNVVINEIRCCHV